MTKINRSCKKQQKSHISGAKRRRKLFFAKAALPEPPQSLDPESTRNRSGPEAEKHIQELLIHQFELKHQYEELLDWRHKAESSALLYAELYNFAPTAFLSLDRIGTISKCNRKAATLLFSALTPLEGMRLGIFFAREDLPAFNDFLTKVFLTEKIAILELQIPYHSQTDGVMTLLLTAHGALDSETCVVAVTDVSTQTRMLHLQANALALAEKNAILLAEKAVFLAEKVEESRRLAALSDQHKAYFIASMSHEIRTPLAIIKGFAELAKSTPHLTPELESWLGSILNGSIHLEALVNDILDISKIEAGKMDINPIDFNLREFIDETMRFILPKAAKKGLEVKVIMSEAVPTIINSDPNRLKQILINVIDNGIKFTEQGKIQIQIDSVLSDQLGSKPKLSFQVVDEGIGIDRTMVDRLFKSFSQADSSIANKFGGTGLGLSLSRYLARLLGGDIVYESPAVAGSIFTITIELGVVHIKPAIEGDDTANKQHLAKAFEADKVLILEGMRILLAEDSLDLSALIAHVLKVQGAEVVIALNGLEAMEMALGSSFDLVIMDIQMPVLNGYEATRELRNQGYAKPIIAMTAQAMRGERERNIAVGFTDYFSKPIQMKKLIEVVASFAPSFHADDFPNKRPETEKRYE